MDRRRAWAAAFLIALACHGPERGSSESMESIPSIQSMDPMDGMDGMDGMDTGEEPGETPLVNRLGGASSPYLLLHAEDPVPWQPWDRAALERARREGKPIFLSVGYSSCYWCHVMGREAFSDPEVAAVLAARFVPIKVDREERPDLDDVYMAATQVLAGRGGWPNSVFLTPDLRPFYAGTYLPLDDARGLPGFRRVLAEVATAWTERRGEVEALAGQVTARLETVLATAAAPAASVPGPELADRVAAELRHRFDAEHGGFAPPPRFAPKFLSAPELLLLLDRLAAGDETARGMLATSLGAMARGGVRDHLGGGFHRYAVDREWRVPHFEKMLYDQALLLAVYARWHAATGDAEAARIVRETATFVAREMTGPRGEPWSALDAETDAEEGRFYTWTRAEVADVLGAAELAFWAPLHGLAGEPPLAGDRHVVHLPRPLSDDERARSAPLDARLRAARERRERPRVDDKVLADWSGLAIGGLATAGRLLGDPDLVARAARAAAFVLAELRPEGGPLLHRWHAGKAGIPAFLADYAYLVEGLLALHDATGDTAWLAAAADLAGEMTTRLAAPDGGFYAAADDPDLLVRPRDTTDAALPAPAAVAVSGLLTLADRTGDPAWRARAEKALRAMTPRAEAHPAAHPTLARALLAWHHPPPPSASPDGDH